MLITILIIAAVIFVLFWALEVDDLFLAFIGVVFVAVLGLNAFLFSLLVYYPNQHTSTHNLEELSTGSYVQIVDDTYTFKVDGKIIVEDKDDLAITLLDKDSTAKAKVAKNDGGFNIIGYEPAEENYELKIPSDIVEKLE